MTTTVKCYWAPAPNAPLVPATIERRAVAPHDVLIDVAFAGICHSDIHNVADEWKEAWGSNMFPMVPGHEISGHVSAVGAEVTKFKVGDRVGVGCMVDSCRSCTSCHAGEEQFCHTGSVLTYAARFKYPHCAEYTPDGGNVSQGGYSQKIVVDESFVCTIPDNLPLDKAAPLLCAGVTTYGGMAAYGLKAGQRFGVAGLGGLGHVAVKIALAMGAHVTVLSRGVGKRDSALNDLKAHEYLDTSDTEAVKKANGSFDFIMDTISANHDLNMYLRLLHTSGKLVVVGAPPEKQPLFLQTLIEGRRTIGGSMIGGIRETQEMLDFCGKHNITCDIELIRADQINDAYARALSSDVKYRFVIDAATF